MRRSIAGAALAAAGLAVALVGCAATPQPEEEAAPVTLTAVDGYVETTVPQGEAIAWLYDTYMELNPNVTIEKTAIAQNLLPQLQAMAQTDSMPDIAITAPQFYPALSATGKLRPLNDLIETWGMSDQYMESVVAATSDPDGTIGGVFIGTNTLGDPVQQGHVREGGHHQDPRDLGRVRRRRQEADQQGRPGLHVRRPEQRGLLVMAVQPVAVDGGGNGHQSDGPRQCQGADLPVPIWCRAGCRARTSSTSARTRAWRLSSTVRRR